MTDYQKYINALRKCAKEHENDRTPTGHIRVSDLCRDTANLLEEEREETGHWIYEKHFGQDYCICSKCSNGIHIQTNKTYNYCPNCGAKMIKPQESEDNGWK